MKNILFLVGPHASGKTFSTKELIKNHELVDTIMIDTGPIMRAIHKKDSPETSIDKWVSNIEKKYGKDATSKLITHEIEQILDSTSANNCILIGFRSLKGILYTIENLKLDSYSILYVDAPFELLYKNFMSRGEKEMSRTAFSAYLQEELATGLGVMKNMALNNSNLIDYYYRESNDDHFENILFEYIKSEPKIVKRKEKKHE